MASALPLEAEVSLRATPSLKALAIGCSERDSKARAIDSALLLSTPSAYQAFEIVNLPFVSVPVLSKAMVSMSVICSSASARFSKIPCRFNFAIAQVNADGVANPSAQGQVATSTDMVIQNASSLP